MDKALIRKSSMRCFFIFDGLYVLAIKKVTIYRLCRKHTYYVLTTEFTENTEDGNIYSSP